MTTIQDTLTYADGQLVNGIVVVYWDPFQLNGAPVAGGMLHFDIVNGNITISLYSNANALPAGTYYTAKFELENGAVYEEYWVVPNYPTVTLGQCRVQFPPTPSILISAQQLTSGGAQPGMFLAWNGTHWVPSYVTTLNVDPDYINLMLTANSAPDLSVSGSPVKLGSTVTLNVPDASTSSRGVVTTGPQSFAGTKLFQNPVAFLGGIQVSGSSNINGYVPSTRQVIAGYGLTGGGALSQDRTLAVVDRSSVQKIQVDNNGAPVGIEGEINFVPGNNIIMTITDDPDHDRVNISVASTGGGGGGSTLPDGTQTGDIIVWQVPAPPDKPFWNILPPGPDGQVLTSDASQPNGIAWLPGLPTPPAGATGSLLYWNGSGWAPFVPGPNGEVLTADSTQPAGLSWTSQSGLQTPWLSDIDAANHSLGNVKSIGVNVAANPSIPLDVVSAPMAADPAIVTTAADSQSIAGITLRGFGMESGFFVGASNMWWNPIFQGQALLYSQGDLSFWRAQNPNDATALERMRIVGATGYVGVGLSNPLTRFEVAETQVPGAIRGFMSAQYNDGPHAPTLYMAKYRGTPAAPTPAQSGDFPGYIGCMAYTATGGLIEGASISALMTGATANTVACDLILSTNPGAGPNAVDRLHIAASGIIGLGNNGATAPDVDPAIHLVIGPALNSGPATLGEVTLCANTAAVGANVGILNFANYAIPGTDKRIAAIAAATVGGTNSGALIFYNWNAGVLAQSMYISPAGRVAIGNTNNPQAQLHVAGPGASVGQITIQDTVTPSTGAASACISGLGSDANRLWLLGWPGGGFGQNMLIWNDRSGDMEFGNGGLERMRLTNAGNLGIGTTTPSCRLSLGQLVQQQVLAIFDGLPGSFFGFGIANSVLMYTAGGSVQGSHNFYCGLGAPLRFSIQPSTMQSFGRYSIYGNSEPYELYLAYNSGTFGMWLGGDPGGNFVISNAGGNEYFWFTTNGLLGVGVASPQAQIHVLGNGSDGISTAPYGSLIVAGGDPSFQMRFGYNSGVNQGWIQCAHDGVSFGHLVLQPAAMYVGVGLYNPQRTLDVNGGISLRGIVVNIASQIDCTNHSVVYVNGSGVISGLAGGVDGALVTLINMGGGTQTYQNNSSGVPSGNRILMGAGSAVNIAVFGAITCVWSGAVGVWILIAAWGYTIT